MGEQQNNPTPDYYNFAYKGVKLDPARVMTVWGVTNPMAIQAIKKTAFAGKRGHKDAIKDVNEAIKALCRYREMIIEDSGEVTQ